LELLTASGYSVSFSKVYCPDYGIPQKRRRLVLLASRYGEISLIGKTHDKSNYITAREIIGELPRIENGQKCSDDALHFTTTLSDINLRRIRASKPNGTWMDWDEKLRLPCHSKASGNTYKSVYGRMAWNDNLFQGHSNKVDYIRKLIALYFRFSLLDKSFNIYLNDSKITLDELSDLANDTQLLWVINDTDDGYVTEKLLPNSNLQRHKKLKDNLLITGFIASVVKPSHLKIRGSEEKVSIDLYVNGRLREKDLLKHIPTTRVVESYLYGQIHYNGLDDETDRFTSSREGIVSDDPKFIKFLNDIRNLLKIVIEDWDIWRIELNQEGDSENKRITQKERKSKELFNTIVDEFIPPKDSSERSKVEDWVNNLRADAEFNFASYGECFVSENLLRNAIRHKSVPLSKTAQNEVHHPQDGFRARENRNKLVANISFEIRQNPDDLSYLEMKSLAFLLATAISDQQEKQRLEQDAKEYKPIRDAVAHTALLTSTAKGRLTATYENIKTKVKELLRTP
jgi:hypothetical protein